MQKPGQTVAVCPGSGKLRKRITIFLACRGAEIRDEFSACHITESQVFQRSSFSIKVGSCNSAHQSSHALEQRDRDTGRSGNGDKETGEIGGVLGDITVLQRSGAIHFAEVPVIIIGRVQNAFKHFSRGRGRFKTEKLKDAAFFLPQSVQKVDNAWADALLKEGKGAVAVFDFRYIQQGSRHVADQIGTVKRCAENAVGRSKVPNFLKSGCQQRSIFWREGRTATAWKSGK